MILVGRREKMNTVASHRSSEKGLEVVSCAYGIAPDDMPKWFFAGITRSKSVTPIDDGAGPQTDEWFTTALAGMATLVNNSRFPIGPGDELAWTIKDEFYPDKVGKPEQVLSNGYPRRITVEKIMTGDTSAFKIGRALTYARPDETFDLLISAA